MLSYHGFQILAKHTFKYKLRMNLIFKVVVSICFLGEITWSLNEMVKKGEL